MTFVFVGSNPTLSITCTNYDKVVFMNQDFELNASIEDDFNLYSIFSESVADPVIAEPVDASFSLYDPDYELLNL